MKKTLLPVLILLMSTELHAQITVDNSDMPVAGDKIRVSIGQVVPGINLSATGANHLWDFSNLQWTSQNVDTFLNVSQTGTTYQIVFANVSFNPNRANLAIKSNLQTPPGGGISISDVFAFFYNSSASYKQVGYGAGINGFPTPIPFNNHDVIYNFPLNFGNSDSSNSDFSIGIPNLGYYGYTQKRVNVCDGWGSLITPYGQFDVLRIKSTLTGRDSIYLDTLGFGIGFNRPLSREYKWIGKSKSIPLLQINTTVGMGGTETINLIRYQDSLRVLSVNEPAGIASEISVYPNPAKEILKADITVQKQGRYLVQLCSTDGKKIIDVFNGELEPGKTGFVIFPKQHSVGAGIYHLILKGEGSHQYCKVAIDN